MSRRMFYIAAGTIVLGCALVIGAGGVSAHKGATGVVKQRMALMGRVAKSARSISEMMMGIAPYNAGRLRREARRIAGHGADKMTRLFPEGSIKGPSTAVPGIWREWGLFAAYAADMRKYALALASAANNRRHAMGARAIYAESGATHDTMSRDAIMAMMGGMREPVSDARTLARLSPDAAFGRLMHTCGACHTRFRRQR